MSVLQAQLSLSDDDLQQARAYCQRQQVTLETLFLSAWLFTLSVYSAGPNVATTHVKTNGTIASVVGNFEGGMTAAEAISSLEVKDTEGQNVKQDLEASSNEFPNDFHYNGTLVGIVTDKSSRDICAHLMKRFETKAGGLIRACVIVHENGQLDLRCVPDSIPCYSPEALLDTFAALLRKLSSDNDAEKLIDMDVLGPLNRGILESWTKTDFKRVDRCVHDLIEEYASANPDKDAVVAMEGRGFTYGELSAISTSLAMRLMDLGVKKGDIVPTLMDKSQFAILSCMAIIKAGAIWVGFSTESPVNFLRQCATIADVNIICTTPERKGLVEQIGCQPLVVGDDLIDTLDKPDSKLLPKVEPTDVVYLVFTSGSTGTPKAVMNEHGAFSGCAIAQMEHRLLDETRRVLQFSSYNFDAINGEIFSPLIAGATICVPTEYSRMNCLSKAINELRVDYMGLPPTLAKMLDPKTVPGLKVFTMAGEPIGRALVEQWMSAPNLDVIDVYGPSEACMDSSANIYTRHSTQENNIGRVFRDVCAGHVVNVDNHHQLLPVGSQGELLIQGSTLGRGYLKEPEKTAKAYISDPAWMSQATVPAYRRFYKTGDIVRQLPDESFLIFSRIDKQVKLNGQRMELGEIEYNTASKLRESCKVAVELIQLSWRHQDDSKVLVAFYSSKAGRHGGTAEDLIDHAAELYDAEDLMKRLLDDLKPIAIPRAYIPLTLMPTTTQGKLDRKILQELGTGLDQDTFSKYAGDIGTGEPVQTDSERVVQGLFAHALGLRPEQVARDSNFFWLGGDSIRAMKLIAFAQKQIIHLSVPDVLQNPKLYDIASLLDKSAGQATTEYHPLDGIRDTAAKGNELLEAAVKAIGNAAAADIEDLVRATDYQTSCVAWSTLQKRGAINWLVCDFAQAQPKEQVERLCDFLTSRHAILRTSFVVYRRAVYLATSKAFKPPITAHQNLGDVQTATDRLVDADRRRKIDIGQPQTAFELLSRGAENVERLLIRVSHAQYDGHSISILSKDIKAFFKGQTEPLTGTFAGYLHLSRTLEREAGVEYWRSLLSGATATELVQREHEPLFLDLADSAIQQQVPTRLLKAPKALSKATGVKTAWSLTLADMTGKDDIVFGSTVWGRNAPVRSASDVFGSTLSHIATRARTSSCKNYMQLMEQLQSQHLQSMRFESLGANTIVELCTDWKRWTRFSSLVTFQGLEIDAPSNENGASEKEDVETSISEIIDPADRTDFLLHVEPAGDETRVILRFSKKKFPQEVAQMAMDKFVRYLELATQHSDSDIQMQSKAANCPLPTTYNNNSDRSNGTTQTTDGANTVNGTNGTNGTASAKDSTDIASIVAATWQSVLDLTPDEVKKYESNRTSFFDIWGNLASAAALAREYNLAGYAVKTEDMMRNPTMEAQRVLLSHV